MNRTIEISTREITLSPLQLQIQSQSISIDRREWYEKLRSVGTLLVEHKASPNFIKAIMRGMEIVQNFIRYCRKLQDRIKCER